MEEKLIKQRLKELAEEADTNLAANGEGARRGYAEKRINRRWVFVEAFRRDSGRVVHGYFVSGRHFPQAKLVDAILNGVPPQID